MHMQFLESVAAGIVDFVTVSRASYTACYRSLSVD